MISWELEIIRNQFHNLRNFLIEMVIFVKLFEKINILNVVIKAMNEVQLYLQTIHYVWCYQLLIKLYLFCISGDKLRIITIVFWKI